MTNASPDVENNDKVFNGQCIFAKAPSMPSGSFGNSQINVNDPIAPSNLIEMLPITHAQAYGVAVVSERVAKYVARNKGTVLGFRALLVLPCTVDDTVTVDVKKNGTTILTAVVTLNNAAVAYQAVVAAIADAPYVANDVFEFIVTATHNTGVIGQGLLCTMIVNESGV